MGRYIKLICPNCEKVIKDWHLDNTYGMTEIGNPFELCPYCNTLIRKKGVKEKYMLTPFDYIKMWIVNIFGGLLISLFPVIIIGNILANLLNVDEKKVHFIMSVIYIGTFVWCMKRMYDTQKRLLKESEERTNMLKKTQDMIDELNKFNKK